MKAKAARYFFLFFLVCAVFSFAYFNIFRNQELALYDLRMQLRLPQAGSSDIVIIEIDDNTLKKLKAWPLPRYFYTALLKVLQYAQARQVIFDILFPESSPDDKDFAGAMKKSGNVYLPWAFRLKKRNIAAGVAAQPNLLLKNAAKGIGQINTFVDPDGKIRRLPLLVKYKGKEYLHIILKSFFGLKKINFDVIQHHNWLKAGPLAIPLYKNGVVINYAGKWGEAFKHYSFYNIIHDFSNYVNGKPESTDFSSLKNKICIVGVTAVGTPDIKPIPLQPEYPAVGILANLYSSFLRRDFIYRLHPFYNGLIALAIVIIICIAAFKMRTIPGFIFSLSFIIAYSLLNYILFVVLKIWVDLFYPLLLSALTYFTVVLIRWVKDVHKRMLLDKELAVAKRIQESCLPKVPEHIFDLEISSFMKTAKEVGGDLYDFLNIRNRKLGILIGDVAGKGVPAALVMAKALSLSKIYIKDTEDPGQLLSLMNDEIKNEIKTSFFITASFLIYDSQDSKLYISSAGHMPTFLYKKNKLEEIDFSEGAPLGLLSNQHFLVKERVLEAGDVVVLYSDGVTEAKNIKREDFDSQRLKDAINPAYSAKDITKSILEAIDKFTAGAPQSDDITIIVIKKH